MEEKIYISALYDIYGSLLTGKQQEYFEDYYFNNLTLQEISENNLVSRNAIFKQIKEAEQKLYFYEEKLKIHEKNILLDTILNQLKDERIKEEIKRIIWE